MEMKASSRGAEERQLQKELMAKVRRNGTHHWSSFVSERRWQLFILAEEKNFNERKRLEAAEAAEKDTTNSADQEEPCEQEEADASTTEASSSSSP